MQAQWIANEREKREADSKRQQHELAREQERTLQVKEEAKRQKDAKEAEERMQADRFQHDEEMMEKEIRKQEVILEIIRERSRLVAQLRQTSASDKRLLMSMFGASASRAEGKYECTEIPEEGEKEPDHYLTYCL